MKKPLYYLLLGTLLCTSCDKTPVDEGAGNDTPAAYIKIEPTETLVLSSNEDEFSISVDSNREWSITTEPKVDWIRWTDVPFSNKLSVTFDIEANSDETERSTKLLFTTVSINDEKQEYASINVKQGVDAVVPSYITTNPTEPTVSASQKELEISVDSNIEWEISMSESKDWCQLPETILYNGNATFDLTLKPNTTSDSRSIKLFVTSTEDSSLKKSVTITQEGLNVTSNTLKVVTWNIWKNNTEDLGDEAMPGIIGVLKKLDADVILVQETAGRADVIIEGLGDEFKCHQIESEYLAIISRYPIEEVYSPKGDWIASYNFAGAKINVNGMPIRVYNTWLHYLPAPNRFDATLSGEEIAEWEVFNTVIDGYDYGTRDEEIKDILAILEPHKADSDTTPMILCGDLNSLSHLDWTEATKDIHGHQGKVVDWKISNIITDAGFTDAYRQSYPNPVTHPGTTHAGPSETEYNRIDYIYYQGETIKPVNTQIYRAEAGTLIDVMGEDFFYGSDHGLVYSEFKLYSEIVEGGTSGNNFEDQGEW